MGDCQGSLISYLIKPDAKIKDYFTTNNMLITVNNGRERKYFKRLHIDLLARVERASISWLALTKW